ISRMNTVPSGSTATTARISHSRPACLASQPTPMPVTSPPTILLWSFMAVKDRRAPAWAGPTGTAPPLVPVSEYALLSERIVNLGLEQLPGLDLEDSQLLAVHELDDQ